MNTPGRWLTAMVATASLGAALALAPVSRAVAASAEPEVEGLQMPAWLTRDGKRGPLALGAQLRNGDTITTGAGSRVVLRMPEGSAVKLGEKARFELNEIMQKRDGARRLFSASLGVP